jgi:prevent-host-death family protein
MEPRISIGEAKARFAEWIRRAERGEAVVLTRHGRPVARLVGLGAGRSESGARAAAEGREGEAAYGAPRRAPATPESRRAALEKLLEEQIWPRVPEELLGKGISKREREEILGLREGGA